MNINVKVQFEHLGQSGLKIDLNDLTILVDPYLSNSVQDLDASDLCRQVPIPYQPHELTTVDWILITHEHLDHCDPHTLPALAEASPSSVFVGPAEVRKQLALWGLSSDRILSASSDQLHLGYDLQVSSIPAAHPRIRFDHNGQPQAVGYLLTRLGRSVYIAGDTSVCDELIDLLVSVGPIDFALLPVNEDNYFRRKRGIVGNMSIREAFGLAAFVGIKGVVPVHWDMFEVNSTSLKEVDAVYESKSWPFTLNQVSDLHL